MWKTSLTVLFTLLAHLTPAQNQTIDTTSIVFAELRMNIRDYALSRVIDEPFYSPANFTVPDSAYERSGEFWQRNRTNELTAKDTQICQIIDSIGKQHHFDSRMKVLNTMSTGYYPYKFLNIDLTKIFNYNEYEGFRLGLGLMTNDMISELFSVGGYFGYGFRDKDWKFGGEFQLNLHEESESNLEFTWVNDVVETGGYRFLSEQGTFSTEMYRQYMVERMDRVRRKQMAYSFRVLKYVGMKLYLRQSQINPFADYQYLSEGRAYDGVFHISEAGIRLRYAWRENFAETPWGEFSLGTDYPVFYGNFIKGMNWPKGNFEYTKFEASVSDDFHTRNLGKTAIKLVGGMAKGEVPAFNLYTGHGSYGSPFNIYSANSFATMRLTEFLADRFVSVYLSQDFKSLLFSEDGFNPRIIWENNLGWGWLNDLNKHQGIDLQSFEKGYFETGLIVDDVIGTTLFNYGIGVFYRYGPYAFNKFSDNLAYKLSIRFNFDP